MMQATVKTSVKVVGSNGQISLGKEFAGRQIVIEEEETGVWKIRTASVIPDNEMWLHQPLVSERLDRALKEAQSTKPKETTDLDALLKDIEHGRKQSKT